MNVIVIDSIFLRSSGKLIQISPKTLHLFLSFFDFHIKWEALGYYLIQRIAQNCYICGSYVLIISAPCLNVLF